MQGSMIAAIIILMFACLFTLFMVYSIASSIQKKLKKEVFRYIKIFNQYVEKEQEVKSEVAATSLDVKETEPVRLSEVSLPIPYIPKVQPMQNKEIFDDYMIIRRAFQFDINQMIDNLTRKIEPDIEKEEKVIRGILEKLSFENVYKISILQPEEQRGLLMEIFDAEEVECLHRYEENREGPFDCIYFVTCLKNRIRQMKRTIYVHTNTDFMMSKNHHERVCFCKDDKICEGFQIYYGDCMYDYGILKSDLSNE